MEFTYGNQILVNKNGEKINESDLRSLIGENHCQWIVRSQIAAGKTMGVKYCVFNECFKMIREYISENIASVSDCYVEMGETYLDLSGQVQILSAADEMSVSNYIVKWIID